MVTRTVRAVRLEHQMLKRCVFLDFSTSGNWQQVRRNFFSFKNIHYVYTLYTHWYIHRRTSSSFAINNERDSPPPHPPHPEEHHHGFSEDHHHGLRSKMQYLHVPEGPCHQKHFTKVLLSGVYAVSFLAKEDSNLGPMIPRFPRCCKEFFLKTLPVALSTKRV